jgi:hypothetical protein
MVRNVLAYFPYGCSLDKALNMENMKTSLVSVGRKGGSVWYKIIWGWSQEKKRKDHKLL